MPTWVPTDLLPYIYIVAVYLATWLPSLRGGFVSDDLEGVAKFSDRWDAVNDRAITTYEVDHGGKKFQLGHRAFNKYVTFPGSVIRWLRLNLGASFQIIGKNKKGHDVYGYVQSPFKHHTINVGIHLLNCCLAYAFLSNLFGSSVALQATIIFIVHPLGCQAIAWCSGIGYLLSLLGTLISFNIALHFVDWRIVVPAVSASTLLSVSGMMAGVGTFVPLYFLGYKYATYAALLISVISLYKQGRSIVEFRSAEFKKQQMGRSTYFTWRKPIVMVKTAYYYLKLILWPKRLGLFHTWGYHFDERLERVDGMFWRGALTLALLGWAFLAGPMPVQFGLLWMLVYVAIFLNFITAQQFVADRYAFIPTLGFSIIAAYFLQPYPALFTLLVGLYMMRTWVHLPTFEDEVKFYQSNIWNFPNSEVAYGNLGVIYANRGQAGAAADTWMMAATINPLYDVPHYNLYSMYKTSRQFQAAKAHLQRCLDAKIVHFPDLWTKEMADLDRTIELEKRAQAFNQALNDAINQKRYDDVPKIQAEFEAFVKSVNPPPKENVK